MSNQPLGELLPRFDEGNRRLVMRTSAGTATGEDGTEYELATNTFSGEPVIACQGRMWMLPWRDLVNLARDRGLLGFRCPCGVKTGPQVDGSPPEGWLFAPGASVGDGRWYCPDCAEGVDA